MTETHPTTESPRKTYSQRKRGKKLPVRLDILQPDAAGIDVGSRRHYVSVPEDRAEEPVRNFGCFTPDLEEMAIFLKQCGIRSVVMESTGVYWVPVFRVLEAAGFEVMLVNPRHVKHVPGRKTDVLDCQWLRQLHTFGLLRGAFVPAQDVASMRTYWRQRKTLVADAAREIQHIQKALTNMNLHLHVVLSDISGMSGMKILRAILSGERDPNVLAGLAHVSVKANKKEIAAALTGHYTEEHLFVLRQSLEHYDFLRQRIHDCDTALETYLKKYPDAEQCAEASARPRRSRQKPRKNQPCFDVRSELIRITGVDLTRIDAIDESTAFTIVSEIGFSPDAFPNEDHFASWIGLCPNHIKTGDKIRSSRTRCVANPIAEALRLAAQSLHKSHSYLGAMYRRYRARLGAPKAITAMAHRLAILVYRMLRYGQDYVDKGEKAHEEKHREQTLKSLARRAKELGYELIQVETGECQA